MPTIDIDLLKERNNFITVSDFFEVTSNTIGRYSVKPIFEWSMAEDSVAEWIKINALESTHLNGFEVYFTGTCDYMVAEISDDNFNWTEIYSGNAPEDEKYVGKQESFRFIRFRFVNLIGPFSVESILVNIKETYDNNDFISFLSESHVPVKIREKNPLMEDFIKTFMEMLEDNTVFDRRLISADFFMHAVSDLDSDQIFAINSRAINTHAVNGEAP